MDRSAQSVCLTPEENRTRVNVADRLAKQAAARTDSWAVIDAARPRLPSPRECLLPSSGPEQGKSAAAITFGQLDRDVDAIARALVRRGVTPGMRLALLVKPSIEFVTLVFALLRSGATMVLVDAALGRKNLVRCLAATQPEGFVAIPMGHIIRLLYRRQFPQAQLNVTVGTRWGWGGGTFQQLLQEGRHDQMADELPLMTADAPAAIVFTSGSTGPPKGVVYRHETFATQLGEIEQMYHLTPGGIDLACFPLFGLFNIALGMTTILPEMDFSRPASADPKKLLAVANTFKVTQSFASPAVWNKLSRHCEETGERIPTLKRVFSCGAPVPASVIRRTLACVHPEAELHTPYGATESLPVSTIEAQEILTGTEEATASGAGVCVGRPVESIAWRIIEISDEPIATLDQTRELPVGEIGELIVSGPQVSRRYLPPATGGEDRHNAGAKIQDGDTVWHRIGDVGYFDPQGRFWYCGRKSHRVVTPHGTLFTECVEQRINQYPGIDQSALVGVGLRGEQVACVAIELAPKFRQQVLRARRKGDDLLQPLRQRVADLLHPHRLGDFWCVKGRLPTDIRHNAKIRREELAKIAMQRLVSPPSAPHVHHLPGSR